MACNILIKSHFKLHLKKKKKTEGCKGMSVGRGGDQLCAPPQLVGVMLLLDSRVLLCCYCCTGQTGYFAFLKYFYDKSCSQHAFKILRLQLEKSSRCLRGVDCSGLTCTHHSIEFLVLIFKRTLPLRSDELLSKSFSPCEPERSLLTKSQSSKTFYVSCRVWTWTQLLHWKRRVKYDFYKAVRLLEWNTVLITGAG